MNKEEVIKKLICQYPNAEVLRSRHPKISHLLEGEFSEDPFNVYESPAGIVVSRRLRQGEAKDPTVGIITPGKYEFPTGSNIETMTFLQGDGCLDAKVNESLTYTLRNEGERIIAPAGATLKLAALSDVFYICFYRPKK
jgi:uncharacterized protein YaiE (UPF0345 family)